MAATKEQEREAIRRIMEIVDGLGGADSYVGMALEGFAEIAESNIENDFGESWKSRAEKAQADADEWERKAKCYEDKIDEKNQRLKEQLRIIDDDKKRYEELWQKYTDVKNRLREAEVKVTELKVRIFDMMERKEGKQ